MYDYGSRGLVDGLRAKTDGRVTLYLLLLRSREGGRERFYSKIER